MKHTPQLSELPAQMSPDSIHYFPIFNSKNFALQISFIPFSLQST